MDPKIIDGKALAKKHEDILRGKLSKIKKDKNPLMVSFCNMADPSSVKYTSMKKQKAEELGIDFIAEEFFPDTTKEKLTLLLKQYSTQEEVFGILIQLPLPEQLDSYKTELLGLIPSGKDVDGLTGRGSFLPATVKGVTSLLEEYVKNWQEKIIAVVGATGEVGGDMVAALKQMKLKPLEISRRANNFDELKIAQIIISATGQENLIKPEMISEGVVLIDVGLGDFDAKCYNKASLYTPVIGGVGPMTVISLMENVVESYEKRMVK